MTGRWVDYFDRETVITLARDSGIDLDSRVASFLEAFADMVDRDAYERAYYSRHLRTSLKQLHASCAMVAQEVAQLQAKSPQIKFTVTRHRETYLPIVCVSVPAAPQLVVHVPRAYASNREGVTFGLCLKNRRKMTGLLAMAAHQLTYKCRAAKWTISITDILQFWIKAVSSIPPFHKKSITGVKRPRASYQQEGNAVGIDEPRKRGKWKRLSTLTNSDPTTVMATASTYANRDQEAHNGILQTSCGLKANDGFTAKDGFRTKHDHETNDDTNSIEDTVQRKYRWGKKARGRAIVSH